MQMPASAWSTWMAIEASASAATQQSRKSCVHADLSNAVALQYARAGLRLCDSLCADLYHYVAGPLIFGCL
jgi:hypothetical protein